MMTVLCYELAVNKLSFIGLAKGPFQKIKIQALTSAFSTIGLTGLTLHLRYLSNLIFIIFEISIQVFNDGKFEFELSFETTSPTVQQTLFEKVTGGEVTQTIIGFQSH